MKSYAIVWCDKANPKAKNPGQILKNRAKKITCIIWLIGG
jgi:hypothetical protein